MLEAVVLVLFTRDALMGRMDPPCTFVNVTAVPSTIATTFPAVPTYSARQMPPVKFVLSLGVTAIARAADSVTALTLLSLLALLPDKL